jgi:acyl-CoA synthetase (AMP-forming)/AMP-acid ligase II
LRELLIIITSIQIKKLIIENKMEFPYNCEKLLGCDAEGFVILSDRKKDMVISGGFNIYPSDLEAELEQHPEVAEAAVVGVPSRAWGETPVGYVVLRPAATITKEALLAWVNARLGKTQRLADLLLIADLPRNEIGKTLKRQLREQYVAEQQSAAI